LEKYKKPDLVIVLTGANDSWNLADSDIFRFIDKDNEVASYTVGAKLRVFISELRIYKMLKMVVLNFKGMTPESNVDLFEQSARYEDIDRDVFRRLTEYNLTQIAILMKSDNIGLVLQDYPKGDPFGYNPAQEVASRFNTPFVRNSYIFYEALKEASPEDLFIYDNSHPNKRGYSMMVEELYKIISERIIKDNFTL